jgi:multiple sugar transport system permease protein
MHQLELLLSHLAGHEVRFLPPMWIYSAAWSKPSLILMNLWAAGGGMIIWLAGLQSIPGQLYEAAAIDGANRWRQFRHVTIPMLTPYILFNLIIGIIGTMQIFSEAYIMTAGGPADSTLFYAYYLFKEAFQYFRMGYASALAWILFVLVLALTLLQVWLSNKWVHYEQA